MIFDTPIALFIFNRPLLTIEIFKAIAQVRPRVLLVVADGARTEEEAKKCEQTQKVIELIDWDCDVRTNYSAVNLGCKRRVSSGLDWVFSEVEEAIVLEDDCLASPPFFTFCQTLLERYRHDERIMHIGGANFQAGQRRADNGYYFSKYAHVWGWATWRRAWQCYDVEMQNWEGHKEVVSAQCDNPREQQFWNDIFDRVHNVDTWDYQWLYACWSQNGLAIIPDTNLVANIGFGEDATHTLDVGSPFSNMATIDLDEIKPPLVMVRHKEADSYTFDHMFGGALLENDNRMVSKVKRRLQSLIG